MSEKDSPFQPPNNWRQTTVLNENGETAVINWREVPPMSEKTDDKEAIEFAKKLRHGHVGATTTHSEPVSEEIANLRNDGFASGPSGNLHLQHGPDSPKVTVDELVAAFQDFQAAVTRAMRSEFAILIISEARNEFRAFCEERGLADRIDWEERL